VSPRYNVRNIKAKNVAIGDEAKAGDHTDSEPPAVGPPVMVPVPGEAGDAPVVPSRGVFLSYRHEDAAPYARLLQSLFSERIPDVRVFVDLDSIEPGLDFDEVIRAALDSCEVTVALIGRQWATLADEEGRRRVDNPDDYVRFEIQTALECGVRVIPVLVDGARPLRQQQLPTELHKLARLNALELSYGRYQYDADRLLNHIQQVLAAPSSTGTVHQSPSTANVDALSAPESSTKPSGSRLSTTDG
jgi:TIR domain